MLFEMLFTATLENFLKMPMSNQSSTAGWAFSSIFSVFNNNIIKNMVPHFSDSNVSHTTLIIISKVIDTVKWVAQNSKWQIETNRPNHVCNQINTIKCKIMNYFDNFF